MNFNCVFNLFLFHKSSASQKATNLPLEILIPLFLDKPAPIFLLLTNNFFLKLKFFKIFFT